MTREEQLAALKSSFSGTINFGDLEHAGYRPGTTGHRLYFCPMCDTRDHVATIANGSAVLHCWETGKQWFVVGKVEYIQNTILEEEMKFAALMERHKDKVGTKVTGAEAFRLHTEQGVPPEMLDVDGYAEYDRLFKQHQETSRRKR